MKSKFSVFTICLFFLFTTIPLVLSFGYAGLYSVGLAGILHRGFTFANWNNTIASSEVESAFLFSFWIALTSMFITISVALLLTSFLQRETRHGWITTLIYLPLAMPAVVAAFYIFQLLSKAGFVSRLFFHAGWTHDVLEFPDLIHDAFGIGIIATHVLMALPFFLILFTNLNESENLDELRNVARTLGATAIQSEQKIVMPILLKKAFPTIVLYFIFVLGSYEVPLLLGRQYPQMISVLMIRKLQRFNLLDIPTAYTMAVLYLLLTVTLILVLFKKRKLSYDI